MTSRVKVRNVLLAVINAVGLSAVVSVSHAENTISSSNSHTNACTINGVQFHCIRPTSIPVPDYTLCPERRYDRDYGKPCSFRIKTLRFRALKLHHSGGGQGFNEGTTLAAAYDLSDDGRLVGEAYTDRGIRHAVSVEVALLNVSRLNFFDRGKASVSSSARVIGYNNIIAGNVQVSPRNRSTVAYVWDLPGSQDKAIGLNGNAGVATGVGVNMHQRTFVSGYDLWPVAKGGDGKVHGFLWIRRGPGDDLIRPLGAKGQTSRALDVNDSGRVVGYLTQRGSNRAFLAMNENLELQVLPNYGNESQALDINNNAVPKIVGFAKDRTGARQPVIWQSHNIDALRQLPNKNSGSANAISDAGDIVGDSGGRATIWRDGVVRDLNELLEPSIGATLQSALDINRHGHILVKASDGYYVLMPTSNE